MYLRKWSPVKYLMYLWLAILVWLFARCDTAATMHLAPPPYPSSGPQSTTTGGHSSSISSSISSSGRYVSDSSRTPTSISSQPLAEGQQAMEGLSGGPIPPRLYAGPYTRPAHLPLLPLPLVDMGSSAGSVPWMTSATTGNVVRHTSSNRSNLREHRTGPPNQPNQLHQMFAASGGAKASTVRAATVPLASAGGKAEQEVSLASGGSSISGEQRELDVEAEAERSLQLRWALQMRQKAERRRLHRRRWRAVANNPASLGNRNRRDSTAPSGGGGGGGMRMHPSVRPGQRRNGAGVGGGQRRYCSARDPATLAFEAPIVCEAKVKSMSDRRPIFAATFEIMALHKVPAKGRPLRGLTVRLQFNLTTTNDCDIFRGKFRERGFVREELELGKVYFLFLKPNVRYTNFTILGQPIRKTKRSEAGVLQGVNPNYGTRPVIHSITSNVTRIEGKRVRLVCRVGGQPPPKVAWFKDKRLINRNATKYAQVHLKKRSELFIFNTSAADSGEYECRAKNRYNNSSAFNSTHVKITLPKPTVPTGYWRTCKDSHREVFCHNGGTCRDFESLGELGCTCPTGFSGLRCENKDSNFHPTSSNKQQDCTSQRYAGYYC
uniref:Protein vein n=1 Tax=Anopheles atroparvus TaxID=41427 RepID=A0AAG5D4L1_ANOAO